ncbi:hypothetical protein F4V88_10755 [Neorhizobium galegae]|nr:hypothetical protein F4V88_10755 [Neorhizobium galegae]
MRGPAIYVPGGKPRSVEEFLSRSRSGHRQAAPQPTPQLKFLGSDGRELKRPGIQGWACIYGQAFFANDRYRVIKGGGFINSLYDGKPKRLLFQHDAGQELGSTATGLEFANSLDGLAYRMPLDGNPKATAIYDAVMRNKRACVSVGAEVLAKESRQTSDGLEYDYCTDLTLCEISLCEEGAVSGTYARIVDLDEEEPNLWLACRATAFSTDKAVANVTARAQRLIDALARLTP